MMLQHPAQPEQPAGQQQGSVMAVCSFKSNKHLKQQV
jgi:hypothetical protein